MTIVILGLLYGIPVLAGIAMQGMAMRYLAPVTGVEKPAFMDAVGIATRQVMAAILLLVVLNWLPIYLIGPIVVIGTLTVTVIHCQNVYQISLPQSVLFVLLTTIAAMIGVLLLGVVLVVGANFIHSILSLFSGAPAAA